MNVIHARILPKAPVNDVLHLRNVTEDEPPVLMINGDKDFLVPLWHSEIMDESLKAKGVESELLLNPCTKLSITNADYSL